MLLRLSLFLLSMGISCQAHPGCPAGDLSPSGPTEKESCALAPAEEGVVVFVSFSLPDQVLKDLYQSIQGQRSQGNKGRLVLRGLLQNSFVETAKRLQDLHIEVDIDPELFRENQIVVVPTFIQYQTGKPKARLQGNVSLAYALEKFQEETRRGSKEDRS